MSQSKIASIKTICGQWNYSRGAELTDEDKELFGLCIAMHVMSGAPLSLSALDSLFFYLRDGGFFESTYELVDPPLALPTDEQLAQIEVESIRWAEERRRRGISVKFAWKTGAGIPVYEQEGTCC